MKYEKCLHSQQGAIVGFGSALVDMLLHEKDLFIERCHGIGAKGGMTYVDHSFYDKTLKMTDESPLIVPGGSACNTISGIGRLGKTARFVGKCGEDEMGSLFRSALIKQNVETFLIPSPTSTGKVLSVITPDAQRSMFTFLGASAEMSAQDVSPHHFESARMVHVEGYLLHNESLIREILSRAKKQGSIISLDLASFTVVEAAKSILSDLIREYVDIVVANEDEAFTFARTKDADIAIKSLAKLADIAVVNSGARGSMISYANKLFEVAAIQSRDVVDTTGAGDLWIAGFLYALAEGYSIEKAGALGSFLGYEVCREVGTKLSSNGWSRVEWFKMYGL